MRFGKKVLALLLAVVLCVSMVPAAFAAEETNNKGVTFTATVSPSVLDVSEEEQTVTVTVKANKSVDYDGFGATALIPAGFTFADFTNEHIASMDGGVNIDAIAYHTKNADNVSSEVLFVLTY